MRILLFVLLCFSACKGPEKFVGISPDGAKCNSVSVSACGTHLSECDDESRWVCLINVKEQKKMDHEK